jgi:hypothetical protein
MKGKASVRGSEARANCISFFQQHLHISLDKPKKSSRKVQSLNATDDSRNMRLCLSIHSGFGSETVLAAWQDDDAEKLEMQMTDVAVQVIVTAEIKYRESALRQYEWRVRRKAELEEEERKRKIEVERAEKERQQRIEQDRIERLLRDVAAYQQAAKIRKYVEAIRLARAGDLSSSTEKLQQWSQWALAQDDRIDPAMGGRFLKGCKMKTTTLGSDAHYFQCHPSSMMTLDASRYRGSACCSKPFVRMATNWSCW